MVLAAVCFGGMMKMEEDGSFVCFGCISFVRRTAARLVQQRGLLCYMLTTVMETVVYVFVVNQSVGCRCRSPFGSTIWMVATTQKAEGRDK
jgi:hypothetical protein